MQSYPGVDPLEVVHYKGITYITTKELARLTGVKRQTVLNSITKGNIPSIKLAKLRLIPIDFIDKYKQQKRRKYKPKTLIIDERTEKLQQLREQREKSLYS